VITDLADTREITNDHPFPPVGRDKSDPSYEFIR